MTSESRSLHAASRPFDFRLAIGLPVLVMLALLASDVAVIDLPLAHLFYVPGEGFIGRHCYWLETVLHERVKQAVLLFTLALLVALIASLFSAAHRAWRRPMPC